MSSSPKIAPPAPKPHDALEFLSADHQALLAMFRDYERQKKGADAMTRGKLALRLCHRLSIHCAIKEEFFYPPARVAFGENADARLALVEGELGVLRGAIGRIEKMSAKDNEEFDAAVKALGDTAKHHFEREESELFPKLRHGTFDLAGTGEKLAARQLELSTKPAGKGAIGEARHVLGG